MNSASIPGFGDPTCDQSGVDTFAGNFTATWKEFYNQAHVDNDINSITMAGFCAITESSGIPATFDQGLDLKYGQFIFPGLSTIIDLASIDGWTDFFWTSKFVFHQTVQTHRPLGSPSTRFLCSMKFKSKLFDVCKKLLFFI